MSDDVEVKEISTEIGEPTACVSVSKPVKKPSTVPDQHEIVTILTDSEDESVEIVDICSTISSSATENGIHGASKSPKHTVELNSDEIKVVKEMNSSDKDSCSICLGAFTNRSFLNECFHAFCYYCILQWSEISQTCPLCKKRFSVIIHDVKSITEYKETHIKKDEPAAIPPNIRNSFRQTIRYRTTTRNRPNPSQIPQNLNERRKRRKRSAPVTDDNIRVKEARQRVYANNLFAKTPVISGNMKMRKSTPEFYTEFEGAKHRLFPWIKNELELLLYDKTEHVLFVIEVLWKLLDKFHIKSDEFKREMKSFLFEKTDHFCHELYMFAISPYDWKTYLKKVHYDDGSSVSRWDLSPVRYIGDSVGATEDDTIAKTRWDDETPSGARSESSSVEFIEERELDVSVTDSSESEVPSSPKLLKITNTSSTEDDPIIVDGLDVDESSQNCPSTPVYIDVDNIPATPTPPQSPISRGNSPEPDRHMSPVRYNSPASHPRSSPIKHLNSPCFPCSPIRHNSPDNDRSPSPLKGKGKERKKKKHATSPMKSTNTNVSPIRVLMDDSEPCSSKYLT